MRRNHRYSSDDSIPLPYQVDPVLPACAAAAIMLEARTRFIPLATGQVNGLP